MSQSYSAADLALFRSMVDGTAITVEDERVSKLASYALYHSTVQDLILPNATAIGSYACEYCSNLQTLVLPEVTTIGSHAFEYDNKLTNITLPKVETIDIWSFGENYSLKSVTLNTKCTIYDSAFGSCYKLKELFLTDDTNGIYLLGSNPFSATLITYGLGGIYVPSSLLQEYKESSYWSSLKNYIYSLDDYPVHHEDISDDWATIIANCNNNDVSMYNVGDVKEIQVGDDIWYAQIVAKGADELSNGEGYAPLTWIMKHTYHQHAMHSRSENISWGYCSCRDWLQSEVKNTLPEVLQNGIKTVKKTYLNGYAKDTLTANDTLWIPSLRELYNDNGSLHEDSGPIYSEVFDSATNRQRTYLPTLSTGETYWTRTNSGGTSFLIMISNTVGVTAAASNCKVLIGFCT